MMLSKPCLVIVGFICGLIRACLRHLCFVIALLISVVINSNIGGAHCDLYPLNGRGMAVGGSADVAGEVVTVPSHSYT